MEYIKRAPRRSHSAELRSQVLAQCALAGASVASVAMAHGLNANLVRKWRNASTVAPVKSSVNVRPPPPLAVSTKEPKMKEKDRQRITECLQHIDAWRASAMALKPY